jgi:hypothetical protein
MMPAKLDIRRPVATMERLLREFDGPLRREEAYAILRCWQDDEILDDASRERARRLVQEFRASRVARR